MMRYKPNSSQFDYWSIWSLRNSNRILIAVTVVAFICLVPFDYLNANSESKQTNYEFTRSLENEDLSSYDEPGSVVAVITTPKTGSEGLFQTFINSWECKEATKTSADSTYNCPHDRMVVRTDNAYDGAEIIRQHRQENANGKCLVISAIRDPASWFSSLYSQKTNICENASMSKEEMLQDYRQFVANADDIVQSADSCLHDLMTEFNGGSLIHQSKIMDANGGYSVLTSALPNGVFAGCDLLFLRMEQSIVWPDIMERMVPKISFSKGEPVESLCPGVSDHIKMLKDYELTKEEKIAIYSHGSTVVTDWFDSYGYMDGISGDSYLEQQINLEGDNKASVISTESSKGNENSVSSPESVIAVISTAKTGTGGLSMNFIRSWDCKNDVEGRYHLTYKCPDERLMIRAHHYDAGVKAVLKHREEHPRGQCLIVTSIRAPDAWLPSLYIQKKRVCDDVSMTKEEMLNDYRKFLTTTKDISDSSTGCLPELIKEFNGGSLMEQVKVMDQNGGYSILPAPSESDLAGCELLLLKMENSDQWPDIIKTRVPENRFYRGETRAKQCPKLEGHIKMVQDYELTRDERLSLKNGGDFMADWFDSYGYI